MKNRAFLIVPIVLLLLLSCTYHKTVVVKKPLPPGHAKKITGSKSAKPYAPGQQKKRQ